MFEFIDFEANGLDEGTYPIEVGFTLGEETYSFLIKPITKWSNHSWDEYAEDFIHHISRDMLISDGKDPIFIAQFLNDKLGNSVIYSDAWNYDMAWLNQLFDAASMKPTFKLKSINVLLAELNISDEKFSDSLIELVDEDKAHRAGYDALMNKKAILNSIENK